MLNLVQKEDLVELEEKVKKLTALCLGLQKQIDILQVQVYQAKTPTPPQIPSNTWPYTFKDVAYAQKTGL